jgi:hypothetical protein
VYLHGINQPHFLAGMLDHFLSTQNNRRQTITSKLCVVTSLAMAEHAHAYWADPISAIFFVMVNWLYGLKSLQANSLLACSNFKP